MSELIKDSTELSGLTESETSQEKLESEFQDKETKTKTLKRNSTLLCNTLLSKTSRDYKLRELRTDLLNKILYLLIVVSRMGAQGHPSL